MVDAHRLQSSFGRVAGFGDEFPLYFYSHLFLTHPERERVLLAEVKAPGDVLRPEQRGWLAHFADCRIPATVLLLEWESS